MSSSFDRWVKDPFFSAAEAVQDSADRMESVYRLWTHSPPTEELSRELHTVLGTAKWQLEEVERAVTENDDRKLVGEDTRERHGQFVAAIEERIAVVEGSLRGGKESKMTWVKLDEGERDELAVFLAGSGAGEVSDSCSRVSGCESVSKDDGEVKIAVTSEGSVDERPNRPPRVLSFPGLTTAEQSAPKTRWYRNGFRKWRSGYQHDAAESIALRNRDIEACYDRSKSCLNNCDDFDEKQLDGWAGAVHRQLQRSQYQIQYGRPLQMIVWAIFTILLIVVFVLHVN